MVEVDYPLSTSCETGMDDSDFPEEWESTGLTMYLFSESRLCFQSNHNAALRNMAQNRNVEARTAGSLLYSRVPTSESLSYSASVSGSGSYG